MQRFLEGAAGDPPLHRRRRRTSARLVAMRQRPAHDIRALAEVLSGRRLTSPAAEDGGGDAGVAVVVEEVVGVGVGDVASLAKRRPVPAVPLSALLSSSSTATPPVVRPLRSTSPRCLGRPRLSRTSFASCGPLSLLRSTAARWHVGFEFSEALAVEPSMSRRRLYAYRSFFLALSRCRCSCSCFGCSLSSFSLQRRRRRRRR